MGSSEPFQTISANSVGDLMFNPLLLKDVPSGIRTRNVPFGGVSDIQFHHQDRCLGVA